MKIPQETQLPLLALLAALIGIVYLCTQPPTADFGGRGWDGRFYYSMAEDVAQGRAPHAAKPYALRVALPWLVGHLFPGDLLWGFKLLNEAFGFLSLLLLVLFLKKTGLKDLTIGLLSIVFVISPWGPIRFSAYYPALTDPSAQFFILLSLYASLALKRSGHL